MENSIRKRKVTKLSEYVPDWIKAVVTWLDLARISVVSLLLPRRCFVQIYPNSFEKMGYFRGLRNEIRSYNYDTSIAQKSLAVDGTRVITLRMMLKYVADLPVGNYAELGTFRGISARLIYRHMMGGCELHCFDTFEGFDRSDESVETQDVINRGIDGAFSNTSLEVARRHILDGEPDEGRLILHKGHFPGSFSGLENHNWRFVHLDADLYAPTLEGIKCFYPRLVPGGILLLHDYYSFFSGVSRAAEEYFSKLGVVVVPLADKAGTGVVIKSTV